MSITKNANGKYEVRVQVNNKRIRAGRYDRKYEAVIAEAEAYKKLEKLANINLDNCGKYEPDYEETDKGLIAKLIAALRKRKADRAKDKQTRANLEQL